MKAWQCDHCATQFDVRNLSTGKGVAGPDGWFSVVCHELGRGVDKTKRTYDLCEECATKLLDEFLIHSPKG